MKTAGSMRQLVGDVDSLSIVLDLVRNGEATDRPELQRVTGLGRGLISDRVNQLLESEIIVDGEAGVSRGGRAARELRLNAGAGAILVGFANLTHFHVGVADLAGQLLSTRSRPSDFSAGPRDAFAFAQSTWESMLAELEIGREKVWGVGVGLPAHSNLETATLIDSPSLPTSWIGYPVRERLASIFDAPVWLDTSDNMLALAEMRTGVAKGQRDFIYLNADLAIGCGVVSDSRVMRGAQGAAGNIGHITVGGDELCRCGRRGCLEAVAGGEALLRAAGSAGRSGESAYFARLQEEGTPLQVGHLAEGVRYGDETSQRLVAMSGMTIGRALGATINVLNPAVIVAGGALPQLGDLFLASMRQSIYGHALPFVTRDLGIVVVQQTEGSGLVGAAQMVIDQIFLPRCLAKWISVGQPTSAVHRLGEASN